MYSYLIIHMAVPQPQINASLMLDNSSEIQMQCIICIAKSASILFLCSGNGLLAFNSDRVPLTPLDSRHSLVTCSPSPADHKHHFRYQCSCYNSTHSEFFSLLSQRNARLISCRSNVDGRLQMAAGCRTRSNSYKGTLPKVSKHYKELPLSI